MHWGVSHRRPSGRVAACNDNYRYNLAQDTRDITCPECLRLLRHARRAVNWGALGVPAA